MKEKGAENHCGMTDLLKVATARLRECSWDARDHENRNKTRGYCPALKPVVFMADWLASQAGLPGLALPGWL